MNQDQGSSYFQIENTAIAFRITTNSTSNGEYDLLWIDKLKCKIEEIQNVKHIEKNEQQIIEITTAQAILGIFDGNLQKYLVISNSSQLVAQIQYRKYYKLQNVQFLPFNFPIDSKKHKQEEGSIQDIISFIEEDFYYSSSDISINLQKANKNQSADYFAWNKYLLSPFYDTNVSEKWYSTITQGYIKQFSSTFSDESFTYTLISRRCKEQSGPRFQHRGINDDGFVANYVETESIISTQNLVMAHVICRGSVPTFWKQKGVGRSVKITRSADLSNPAFLKHFLMLKQSYDQIHCVNLMGESKCEQRLNVAFDQIIASNNMEWIKYDKLDMYGICKHNKYDKLNPYMKGLSNEITQYNYFSFNPQTNQVYSYQNGAYRINCLDCLDRTNLFQSRLCFLIVLHCLKQTQHNVNLDSIELLDGHKENEFVQKYQSVWADNGDAISQMYCGTDATTSGLTRKGKFTITGMINHGKATFGRLYNSALYDNAKFEVIDSLLNGIKDQPTELEKYLQSEIPNYCSMEKVKVFAVTWNLGAALPNPIDLTKSIFNFGVNIPDIVMVGLQEIIELNTQNMIVNNQDRVQLWEKTILANLNELGKYIKLESKDLMGIFTSVYVLQSIVPKINRVSKDVIKTGFQGHVGNKGAIVIRFYVQDTLITLCNCHLAAKQKNIQGRINDLKEIHDKLFEQPDKSNEKPQKLLDSEYVFLIGDMNFRLDTTYDNAIQTINDYKIAMQKGSHHDAEMALLKLLDVDQLSNIKYKNPYLKRYQEGGINFLPSYKFNPNEDIYDTSKKLRIPSYCDRILIKVTEPLYYEQLIYEMVDRRESDHRPVVSLFNIQIKKIDQQKQRQLIIEYTNKVNEQQQQHPVNPEKPQSKNLAKKIASFGTSLLNKFS